MSSSALTTAGVLRPPLSQPGPENFIVVSSVPTQNENPLHKNANALLVIGIMEVVLGSISIILGIVSVTIISNQLNASSGAAPGALSIGIISPGLWCGMMILIPGIMGIRLKKHATRCIHISNLLFGILCSFVAFAAFIISMIMVGVSHLISVTAIGIHVTLSVINFVTLILAIVHACYCCTGACYTRTSEGNRYLAYFPQHNAGFVQTDPAAINQYGEESRGTLPYATYIPRSPTVDNQPSNDESQHTSNEEPINATGVVSNSPYTITPYATYTCHEQRNQREREPAHQNLLATPSVVSPVRDSDTAMNENVDYAEPNRIEYEKVPDA